jgi:hypothetical protein
MYGVLFIFDIWQITPSRSLAARTFKRYPCSVTACCTRFIAGTRGIERFDDHFPDELLWEKVSGMASPGFHLQHLTGVLDRLFTYARGEAVNRRAAKLFIYRR